MDEPLLIERARGGDALAFESLLDVVVEPGHRLATGLLQDPMLAQDAVQEAAVRAWRHFDQLREGLPLRPWFMTIVANQCRSMRRARWWSVIRQAEPSGPLEEPSAGLEEAGLRRHHVRQALARLRHGDRLALVLHYYLDLDFPEIGLVVGCSPAGAKTRVYRAVGRLRPLLEQQEVPA